MAALLRNVVGAPASKLDLTVNLGTSLRTQLVNAAAPLGLLDESFGFVAAAGGAAAVPARPESVAVVTRLAAEITAVIAGLPVGTDAELKKAIEIAITYGTAITGGEIGNIVGKRAAALDAAAAAAGGPAAAPAVAIRLAATGLAAAAAAGAVPGVGVAGRPPAAGEARVLYDAAAATDAAVRAALAAGADTTATHWSDIKWLAQVIGVNAIAETAIGAPPAPAEIIKMNIRVIAIAIAYGNNSGLQPNAAINLLNLLNSNGANLGTSILGNPSVTDLHNTILARLSEENVRSLDGIFGESHLKTLREHFTGKLSVYDPYVLAPPVVNPESLDFDKFLPADVLQAVLENRQKKFFPMARVNISPSWFGLFAPGNQLRFELRGGASLDPNMPIEMRGRGSLVYGSAIKGGDYNNWQVVGKNAFISDKLDFALQTAIKRLGNKLQVAARDEIQLLITKLKAAEKEATEAAENLKTVVKANQANGLTGNIADNAALKSAAADYNNRIGKVAKVEGKLGRVYAALTVYQG